MAACAELAETLLRACPGLRVLATSREPLRAAGETSWRVPSLSVPGVLGARPVAETEYSEAGRLFVERAQAALPEFALTERTARAVAEVCRRLDGIPLAIELAAARVRLLDVERIAARLEDRFLLLVGGNRTASPRQQTLRAAVQWSYELLSDAERRLFERLAVFAGGWTLEAAERVCSGGVLDRRDVLDVLGQLVDKSLVVADRMSEGSIRYRMQETLRQYAQERLASSSTAEGTAHRHAEHYAQLAERPEPERTARVERVWLERLEQDHDNLRSALRWTLEAGNVELGMRLAGAVWWLWWFHGYLSEGRRWLDALLQLAESTGTVPPIVRARAYAGAAVLAFLQGDYSRAAALAEQDLALCRELRDKAGTARALIQLGLIASDKGDHRRAIGPIDEGLALAREMRDRYVIAAAQVSLARAFADGGEYSKATTLSEESLSLFRDLGSSWGIGRALTSLGRISALQGNHRRAAALLAESLALCRELGDKQGTATNIETLAAVAFGLQQPLWAARLLGSADALREAIRTPRPAADQPEYDRTVASAGACIGEHAFAAAWADGQAMAPDEAVADTLQAVAQDTPASAP